MVALHTMIGEKQLSVRVLQFNVLADGLAGMDRRHGDFCRASTSSLQWENRKHQLLVECELSCICMHSDFLQVTQMIDALLRTIPLLQARSTDQI